MKEIGVDFNMLEDFYTLPGLQEHASELLAFDERVLCVDFGGDPEDIYIGRIIEVHDDGLVRIKMEWPEGLEEFYYWNEQRMLEVWENAEPVETTGPPSCNPADELVRLTEELGLYDE